MKTGGTRTPPRMFIFADNLFAGVPLSKTHTTENKLLDV